MKGGIAATALPRVAQHETLQTINAVLQQAGLATVRGNLLGGRTNVRPNTTRSGRYLQSLARKATLRLDSSIKRLICRGCRSIMLPGMSAATRIRPSLSADLVVVVRCFECYTRHRLPCPARKDKRFKAIARQRKKRAAAKDARQLTRKASDFHEACDVTGTKPMIVASPHARSARMSQRSRRRVGREKAQELRDSGPSTTAATSEKARRRKRRCTASARDDDCGQQGVSEHPRPSNHHDPIEATSSSKRRKRRKKAVNLDLRRYSDRNADQGALSWKHDLPDRLSEMQKEALAVFRGDHVLSVGLGKGGTVVPVPDVSHYRVE